MPHAVGIQSTATVWRPGEAPLPPAPRSVRGRPAKRLRRDEAHRPVSVKTLATEPAVLNAIESRSNLSQWEGGATTKRFAELSRICHMLWVS